MVIGSTTFASAHSAAPSLAQFKASLLAGYYSDTVIQNLKNQGCPSIIGHVDGWRTAASFKPGECNSLKTCMAKLKATIGSFGKPTPIYSIHTFWNYNGFGDPSAIAWFY